MDFISEGERTTLRMNFPLYFSPVENTAGQRKSMVKARIKNLLYEGFTSVHSHIGQVDESSDSTIKPSTRMSLSGLSNTADSDLGCQTESKISLVVRKSGMVLQKFTSLAKDIYSSKATFFVIIIKTGV